MCIRDRMCSISSIKQKKANKYAAFYYLCRKREKKMGQKEPIELALKLLDNLKIEMCIRDRSNTVATYYSPETVMKRIKNSSLP